MRGRARWRAVLAATIAAGGLLAGRLPGRVDLVVDNGLDVPIVVEAGGRSSSLGPRSALRLDGLEAGAVALAARDPQGQPLAALQGWIPACLSGGPRTWVWDVAGRGEYWLVERSYGAEEAGPPRPLEKGEPLFPLPAGGVQGLDGPWPRELRVSRGTGGAIVVGVVTSRTLGALAVSAPADDALARARLELTVRRGLEAALGGAIAGTLLLLLRRWVRGRLRGPEPVERPIAAARWLAALFALHALLLVPLGRFAPWISAQDFTGYYSIVDHDAHDEGGHMAFFPSLLQDGDVDVWDGDERLFYAGLDPTPTGRGVEYWSLGTPLAWAPFQLGAHAVTRVAAALSVAGAEPDGASPPYVAAAGLGSAASVLLAAWACFAIGRRVGDPRSALCAAALVVFSTPLPFYGFVRSRMDHAVEVLAISLAVWGWLRLRQRPLDRAADVLLGLTWGFAATTRQSNVVLLAGPGLDLLAGLWGAPDRAAQRAVLARAAAFGLGFAPWALLHLTLLWTLWGVPWSAGHEGHFDWPASVLARVWSMLFGGWGIFLQSPVWVLGLVGLGLLLRERATRWFASLCLVELGALFLVAFLFSEERLGGYSFRTLIGAAPFLALGAARLGAAVPARWRGPALLAVAVPLVAWAYLQVVQHPVLIGHETRRFVQEAAANVPRVVSSSLLLRSTCWPRALLLASQAPSLAGRDLWFLLAVPLLWIAVPLLLLGLLRRLAARAAEGGRLGRPLRALVVASLIALLGLELLLLRGVPRLPPATVADRLLASARRTVDDPWLVLEELSPRQRVERWLARAEALAPDHPDLAWTRALREAAWGDAAAALPLLEAERARRPDSAPAAFGVALALRGRHERAPDRLAALLRAVELDPRHLRARLEAAAALREAGQLARADALLEEAGHLAWSPRLRDVVGRARGSK